MSCDTRTQVMLVDDHQIMRDRPQEALENTEEFQTDARRFCERNRSGSASVVARSLTDPRSTSIRHFEVVPVRKCWTR